MKQPLVVDFVTRNLIRDEINADCTLYPDLTRTGCYFPAREGSRVKAHIILELSKVNSNPLGGIYPVFQEEHSLAEVCYNR